MNETVETYAVFKNVDASILKLNEYLMSVGFEMKLITYKTLQDDFYNLFHFNPGSKPSSIAFIPQVIKVGDEIIDYKFWQHLTASKYYSIHIPNKAGLFFMKRIESFEIIDDNPTYNLQETPIRRNCDRIMIML